MSEEDRIIVSYFISSRSVGTLQEELYVFSRRIYNRYIGFGMLMVRLGGLVRSMITTLIFTASYQSLLRKIAPSLLDLKCKVSRRGNRYIIQCGRVTLIEDSTYECPDPVILSSNGVLMLDKLCRRLNVEGINDEFSIAKR